MSSFVTVSPLTGEPTGQYEYASDAQISDALSVLHNSFLKWKKLSASERQKIFSKVAQRMTEKKEHLSQLITNEMGKAIKDSRAEVDKCIKTLERVLEIDVSFLNSANLNTPIYKNSVSHYEPLGVIYSVMPWNYPLWQVVRMFIPALISGNTVLLKHSEITPQMALEIESLFKDVYEEPVFLNLFITHEKTPEIMADFRVGGVSLTGSVRAGQQIYQAAAASFKKVVLELGGSDPYIVLADANLESAAKNIAKARLNNNGQTCISAKRAIVHQSVMATFLNLLKSEMQKFKIGSPLDPETDLGTLAHPKFKDALKKQVEEFKHKTNATCVFTKAHGQSNSKAAFADIEVYLLEKNSSWLKNQEFFGPVLVVIPFVEENEAVEIANSTEFALGAAVFSEDLVRAGELAQSIIAGQVAINSTIVTDLSMPFGGFKSSGIGRELGHEAFFEFTQTKVISNS